MTDHAFSTDVYKPDLGEEVELFVIDCSDITGSSSDILYLCSSRQFSGAVQWRNLAGDALVSYTPVPIRAEGFEASSEGVLPRPKIAISNVEAPATPGAMAGIMFNYIYLYNDILGARLTRYRTLGKYLGDLAYVNAHYPEDVYLFNQKTNQNSQFIEWELAPDFDVQGMMIPRRLILRDVCQLRYRTYTGDGSTFITSGTGQNVFYDDTENACPIDTQSRILLNASGTFATTTNWTCSTAYWSITGANAVKTAGGSGLLYSGTNVAGVTTLQGTYTTASETYQLWINVVKTSGGGVLTVELEEDGVSGGQVDISSSGLHAVSVTAPSGKNNAHLVFSAGSAWAGYIDYVIMEAFFDVHDAHNDTVDVCSHTLAGCRKRFPNQAMPFSGFPGVARTRV